MIKFPFFWRGKLRPVVVTWLLSLSAGRGLVFPAQSEVHFICLSGS